MELDNLLSGTLPQITYLEKKREEEGRAWEEKREGEGEGGEEGTREMDGFGEYGSKSLRPHLTGELKTGESK